nr:methyl-accepting chemotaxis protein [Enterococcus sp. DIV2402]MBO0463109.1 PAS domain S-box protein [Enterococcus sp. DIV2402]
MNFNLDSQQKELFFNAMFKELAVIIFNIDKEVVFSNEKMAGALGYTPEELINVRHQNFCFDEYVASNDYQNFWNSLLIAKKSFQDKIFRKKKNGELIILESVYFPVLDDRKKVINVIKIAFDITKRESLLTTTIKKVQDSSEALTEISIDGNEKISILTDNLKEVDSLSTNNQLATKILEEDIKKISAILTAINSVAQQTKLLSFNASLEAARVGSKASGFSIVASEMQKLANQTKQLTQDIHNNIESINEQSSKVLESSTSTNNKINDSKENLESLLESYKKLLETANSLNNEAIALQDVN